MIGLAAVNVGTPTVLAEAQGDRVWSGIRKRLVDPTTVLWLSDLNLSGDGQADLGVHGGPDKAVYAYPSEHLGPWAEELDLELGDAPFGENLSTVGALERDVRIGDVWEWGSATLQVTQPRWPCFKLTLYRREAHIGERLRTTGRTGWYLRVLETGEVPAAGPIELVLEDPRASASWTRTGPCSIARGSIRTSWGRSVPIRRWPSSGGCPCFVSSNASV